MNHLGSDLFKFLTEMRYIKFFSFKIKALQIFWIFLWLTPAFALSSDQKAPVELSADSAHCQQKDAETICEYLGNVVFAQGTGVLKAPKVTVYKKSDKIYKIEASGNLAHYQTELDENHKLVQASGKIITLYPDKNLMVLNGDGEITEDQNKFTGPYLEYIFKSK